MPRTNGMVPVEHLRPTATPGRVGQATAVEQSRAVAEVQAAVLVAQQCPRDVDRAKAEMRRACAELEMAQRAFYRFPRGGQNVSGPSVHLARELARCWGNIDYGIGELRRDDEAAQSEMRAWAWDQESNARSSSTFIVPHLRDKRGGPEVLTDVRDIYENNANQGARRMREAIFAVLPQSFVAEAKQLCSEALERGDGRPFDARVDGAVAAFAKLGVTVDQLAAKIGQPRERWTPADIGELLVIHQAISQRETTARDEFPPARVTDAEVIASAAETTAAPAPAPEPTAEADPAVEPWDRPAPGATGEPDPPWINLTMLATAGQANGHIDLELSSVKAKALLPRLAEQLVGVKVATADELVADQALAEELLAKLNTPAGHTPAGQ